MYTHVNNVKIFLNITQIRSLCTKMLENMVKFNKGWKYRETQPKLKAIWGGIWIPKYRRSTQNFISMKAI